MPNPYRRYYRCLYSASLRLENDDHVFKLVDEAFTDEIQQLDYQRLCYNQCHCSSRNFVVQVIHGYFVIPKAGICMSVSCHTFYLTHTIMNKNIIHTYEIVSVPAADVRDFMDTLEFHVMPIVQRIDDVNLSIPRSS
ncbi:hypothetical protein N665_0681s0019 [Sinapis alba]|nr:hypothetical protein N665_0681s0019 [Sinapis alba]